MLHKFVNVYVAVCLMLAVVLVGTVRAQTSRGTIVGHITDPSGATVPGARVTATNLGTNISFHYSTDNTGDYYVPGLLPGLYRVEAEKAGFKKEVVSSVTLEVNQTLRVDFTLQLGQTTQTVEVTAAAPMLQTDTTTVGQVVGNRQLVDLPIMGRDFSNLLKLSVAVTELGGTIGASATIRMHGYNDNWRAYSVDGARPTSVRAAALLPG